jgi:hypothetical protein
LPGGSEQDLVDGEVSGVDEGEGDDLGDVRGGDLGLVAELLDALAGLVMGDVVGAGRGGRPCSVASAECDEPATS